MATGVMQFNANFSSDYTYKDLASPRIAGTVSGVTGAPPSGVDYYITSATVKFDDVGYSKGSATMEITVANATADIVIWNNSNSARAHASLTASLLFGNDTPLTVTNGSTVVYDVFGSGSSKINFHSKKVTFTIEYAYTASSVTYQASVGEIQHYISGVWGDSIEALMDGVAKVRVNLTNPNLSLMTHKVTWTCGTQSRTLSMNQGVKYGAEFTVPLAWNTAFPNSDYGTAYCRVETYKSGSLVGTYTMDFSVHVPDTIVPTVSDLQTELVTTNSKVLEINTDPDNPIYVQQLSGVKISVGNAYGAYGSIVRSYIIDGSTETKPFYIIDSLNSSGVKRIDVVCIDSRGRASQTESITINVQPYSKPALSSLVAIRTDSSGNAQPVNGTYCQMRAEVEIPSVSGNNSVTITIQYKKDGVTDAWHDAYQNLTPQQATESMVYGSNDSTATNYFIPGQAYLIRFLANDAFLQTSEKIVPMGTTGFTMFFKEGGNGVGIGMETVKKRNINALEIADEWSIVHGGYYDQNDTWIDYIVPRIIFSATQPEGKPGLIWLKEE